MTLTNRPQQRPAVLHRECVWDFPRPPRLERTAARLRVVCAGLTVAETTAGFRVLETSHPPVYYFPPQHVRRELLHPARGQTSCEFKGAACYWDIEVGGRRAALAAWSYPDPTPSYLAIKDCLAFYAGRVDACYVDAERVRAQAGDFYGGWVTAHLVGPFKGGPGTAGW